jgi:leukotriene-A4 hydrolase
MALLQCQEWAYLSCWFCVPVYPFTFASPRWILLRVCADLAVDMKGKTIYGYCVLRVKAMVEGCSEVVLDTRALKVHKAEEVPAHSSASQPSEAAKDLKFEFGTADAVLGEPLTIECPSLAAGVGTEVGIGINFEVNEASTAIQFLTPEQTASKQHPFLFTQCQAIHARSFCPCQV